MESFLKEVAQDILLKFGTDFKNIALVFPNKRAGLFFRKHLADLIDKPVWSPESFTIQEFVQLSTIKANADRLWQSFILFEAFKKVAEQKQWSELMDYERFYNLGEIILNDFSEIDAYLVDAKVLCKNLLDAKEMDTEIDFLSPEQIQNLQRFWKNFSSENLSLQKQKFIQLWRLLPDVYHLFHQILAENNLTTTGLTYRELAENRATQKDYLKQYKNIIFIGFSALNGAEEKILKDLQNQNIALFYWDVDSHYTENYQQEAGYFLRKNLFQIGLKNQFKKPFDLIDIEGKEINVCGVNGNIVQARLVNQLLQKNVDEKSEDFAIVLADENMLMPVLHALPQFADKVNVTMGFPLINSPLYGFVNLFFKVQTYQSTHKGKIYYKDVNQLLNHPYLGFLDEKSRDFKRNMIKNNWIQVESEAFTPFHENLISLFIQPVASASILLNRLSELITELIRLFNNRKLFNKIDKEIFEKFFLQINRLDDLLSKSKQPLSIDFLAQTLKKIMRATSIPFEGEPLEGLQVMGILETRALDFKNIVILSVNEGILPKVSAAPTFIPDSLRRAYNMTVLEHQDAIFAYYFYRLLQRSETVHLVYNENISEQSSGEPSRFIEQIAFETKIKVNKSSLELPIFPNQNADIHIQKDESIQQILQQYLEGKKHLSPSAITQFLDCSLRFYYNYVADLKEPDELKEEVDAALFGSILHKTMENAYLLLNKNNESWEVTATAIEMLQNKLDEIIPKSFADVILKNGKNTFHFTGNQLIIKEVIKEYAFQILEFDKQFVPFEITGLEVKTYEAELDLIVNEKIEKVKLKGVIDRVDKLKDYYRIIDYKTGSDKKDFKNFEMMFLGEEKDRKAVIQTLIYSYIFGKSNPEISNFEPGLYNVKEMREENFSYQLNNKESNELVTHKNIQEYLNLFVPELQNLVAKIFDKNLNFQQTEDVKKCEYCPYKVLCNR